MNFFLKLSALCLPLFVYGGVYFNNFIFFGDDYTDLGNVPASPFTATGQNWASILGEDFGFSISPSTQGGTDYAYSFSLTAAQPLSFSIPLLGQVELIDLGLSRKDPAFIWSGTNDLVNQFAIPFTPQGTAQNIAQAVNILYQKKFKTLAVANQFNLGLTPDAGEFPLPSAETLTSQVQSINQYLTQDLAELGYDVLMIDLYSLFDDLIANPLLYGFTNVTSAAPSRTDAQGYLFLPFFGFTQPFSMQFHELFAEYIFAMMAGAQFSAHMSEQSITLLRNQSLTILQQLYPARTNHCIGRIYTFISGDYAPCAQPIMTGVSGNLSSQAGNLTFGLLDRFLRDWTIGASAGLNLSNLSSKQSTVSCYFRQSAAILSLFLSHARDHYYLNAIGQYSWLRFDDFHRDFYVGPYQEQAYGATTGSAYDFSIQGAYFVYDDCCYFQTGPLISVDYSQSFIHSLTERGARVGNLQYNKNHFSSLISGIGWEFRLNRQCNWVHWVIDITAEFDYQWLKHESRKIQLKEVSIDGAPFGAFYIEGGRTAFGSVGVNTSGTFCNGQTFSLGYHLNYGENHIQESVISAGYTF